MNKSWWTPNISIDMVNNHTYFDARVASLSTRNVAVRFSISVTYIELAVF